jgi:enoyl-CoA hydratase/carnithine racemase
MSNLTLVEVKNSVATITLNSPKNRNALSIALIQSIIASIKQVEADEKVTSR